MSYTANMDQQTHEGSHENFNMRGMVHKNSVEKLEYLKRQKSLEKQKKYFVRQHSRDENEIKQILQRLQLEQQFHDQEQLDGISVSDVEDGTDDGESLDEFVNPYPLIIVPKFGPPTPLKGANSDQKQETIPSDVRTGRRKSLEYEDIDNNNESKSTPSPIRTTMLAYSFINKLKAPINARKLSNAQDQGPLIDNNMWVGDPEYISSVRRPRKSVAEQNHSKALLRRAKSEIWIRPDTALSRSTPSLRPESPRVRKRSAEEPSGKMNEFLNNTVESQDRGSPILKRKNSREKKASGITNTDISPNISPCMRRTSSLKGNDKRALERKHSGGKMDINDNNERNLISVEISDYSISNDCPSVDNNETVEKSKHARKGSIKDNKTGSKETFLSETQPEPKRKSSLKKKKVSESSIISDKAEGGTVDTEAEHKRSRKISFADQPKARHSSLKERKGHRKTGVAASPGSLEDIKSGSGERKQRNDGNTTRKPRSKSTGSSPTRL